MLTPRTLAVAALAVAALGHTAHAEHVTANLTYNKGDGTAHPISKAVVEIWRYRPGVSWFGGWGWALDFTTATSANGQIDVDFANVGIGVQYQLRVYATNPAAKVFNDPHPFLISPFYASPALAPKVTLSPSDVHDFTFRFTDNTSISYFNIADVIQRGADYAAAHRDPLETDTLGQVSATMQTIMPSSYYDPATKAIRFRPEHVMNDFSVLHEYAHYLEERISGFVGLPAVHDGCTAVVGESDVMDPGYAWMEGFADYFPQAVLRWGPVGTLSGAQNQAFLESPACPGVVKPRASIEIFVAAALYDLLDEPADGGDSFCSAGQVPADTIIFQIFDRELDIGFSNPSLQHFVNAWSDRGRDIPMLRRTLDTHGISVTLPTMVPRYDMNPSANLAVFRPVGAWNSQWLVWGGLNPATDWGRAGDIPVPADYDGDGLTDVAIWRPSDGTWWIRKSASNRDESQQWGTYGDIPLPGDYDGDNETDYAVYRPSTGMLYIFNDGCGQWSQMYLGAGKPVMGDFDGDGIDDAGVYDQYGTFTIQLRMGGQRFAYFSAGKTPVVRDYDGDGFADFATYDPNTGRWAWRSSIDPRTPRGVQLGAPGDIPVPADWDGDGTADFATWTPATGMWRIMHPSGAILGYQWGAPGDIPVQAP